MRRKGTLLRQKFNEYLISTLAMSASLYLAAIVDNIMVGNILGGNALAAVNLTSPVVFIKNIVFSIFIYGGNTLAAMYKGKRDNENADKAFTFSLLFGVIASTVLMTAGILTAQPTAALFSQGGQFCEDVLAYLIPLWVSGPLVVINSGTAAYVRTDGLKKLAVALPVSSNVINLLLDYVYMKWFGWGVAGAGWATVTGYAVGSLLLIVYFVSGQRTVHFKRVRCKDFKILLGVLQTGLPTALIHVCNTIRTSCVNGAILAAAGTVGMQIVTICLSAFNLALIFVNGSATTLMPICGALYGERDNRGIRYVLRFSLVMTEIMCLAVMAVFIAFPIFVGRLFVDISADTADQFTTALRIFSVCIPFYGVSYILRAFYQSTKKRGAASLFTILEGVVFIVPLIYLFSNTNQNMMWLSFAIAEVASIAVTAVVMQIVAVCKKRSSFLMLDNAAEAGMMDITVSDRVENTFDVSRRIRDFCTENQIDGETAAALAVTAKKLRRSAAKYAHKRKNDMDICLRILDDKIVMRFRDNGKPIDPTDMFHDMGKEVDGPAFSRPLTSNIAYNRVLGFNVTTVTVERSYQGMCN